MTEEELIQVYRQTIHEIYRFVAKRTGGDRQLAEDLVQETYLRALSKWKTRAPENPAAWLKTVARNLLVSHFRRLRPASVMTEELGSEDLRLDIEKMENSALLYWGLSKLDSRRAELLEWFHFDGLSIRQIADQKGISERAVEGRLRRAREALREKILDLTTGRRYEHG